MLPSSPSTFRLLLHLPAGTSEGVRRVPLPAGESIAGSDPACHLVLPHLTVSRRHARFLVDAEGLLVEDLGSSNGTRVEGERLRGPVRVAAGARLELGGVRAVVERVEAGDLSPSAPIVGPGLGVSVRPSSEKPTTSDAPAETTRADGEPTLGGAAIEEFLLRRLPLLLELALGGAGPLEVAQALGTEVYRTFPCHRLEILVEEGEAILFRACLEGASASEKDAVGHAPLDLAHRGFRWRSSFATPALGSLLAPLARMGLTLIEASARSFSMEGGPAVAVRGEARTSAGRASSRGPVGRERAPLAPALAPSVPPSLHHSSLDRGVQALLAQVERVARGDIGVLIRGESGTGKEVLAHCVHDRSPFARAPFVAINCASLPRDLLEAELFGIERAVATGVEARPGRFESAHGGTLFLDEIGDMALETQAKILRVLQEGEVFRLGAQQSRPARPRIVAATNRDLEALIEAGSFRRDLYYRVAGFVVRLPPLRERSVDIPNLAARFLAQAGERHGLALPGLSVRAAEVLARYPWPGNIRELKHEIERAALFLQDGELLDSTALDERLRRAAPQGAGLKERLDAFEREEIERALRSCEGDVPRAASLLGVGRSTLYRRMQILGIAGDEG